MRQSAGSEGLKAGDLRADVFSFAAFARPCLGECLIPFPSLRRTTSTYEAAMRALGGLQALSTTRAGRSAVVASIYCCKTCGDSPNGFLGQGTIGKGCLGLKRGGLTLGQRWSSWMGQDGKPNVIPFLQDAVQERAGGCRSFPIGMTVRSKIPANFS